MVLLLNSSQLRVGSSAESPQHGSVTLQGEESTVQWKDVGNRFAFIPHFSMQHADRVHISHVLPMTSRQWQMPKLDSAV